MGKRSLEELNLGEGGEGGEGGPEQDPRRVPPRVLARALQEMRDLGHWEYADEFLGSVFDQLMDSEWASYTLKQWMALERIYDKPRGRVPNLTFREFVTRR